VDVRLLLPVCALATLFAQSPTFEVVSIQAAPPPDPHGTRVGAFGGPGTKEPLRWSAENLSLQDLILLAYDLQPYQLSGPSWMASERFRIAARVPSGASKSDLRWMVQAMLSERFGLRAHREAKETAGYELVVAKSGHKLKEAAPAPNEAPKLDGPLAPGKDGLPILPPGVPLMVSTRGVVIRQAVGESMADLASMLGRQVGRPVKDATGLPGRYDFLLKWTRGTPPGHGGIGADSGAVEELAPGLFGALQEQLGLKLDAKRIAFEALVVDKIERKPTEN
jgi:uncharacterized protein (TIGR03435 family)